MSHDCTWLTYKEWSDLHCQVMRGQKASVDEKETDWKKQKKFCRCQVVQRGVKSVSKSRGRDKAHAAEGVESLRTEQHQQEAWANESSSVSQMPLEFVPVLERRLVNVRQVAELAGLTPEEQEEWGFSPAEVAQAQEMVRWYN